MDNQIRAIRQERGYTQQELADVLKTTKQAISNYELGKHEMPYGLLIRLADLLNVTVDELLGREGTPTPNDQEKGDETMGGSNFKPDVTRKGLEVYTSKGNVVQECYRHRLKKYQLEKILALCDATGKRPREVVKELIDFALSRVVIREITHVDLAFEEPTEEEEEA